MKHFLYTILSLLLIACGSSDPDTPNAPNNPGNPNTEPPVAEEPATFAKGADISWVTEQEADGVKFYDADGKQTDCFALMKKIGMTAIRLRVWVNPETPADKNNPGEGGYGSAYCGKDDVVAKAKRAKAQGLDVMIDFHYSDIFADPGRQATPKAWREKSLSGICELVKTHTTDVLNALKQAGVTPRWIQVGNETRPGMLHPYGQLWNDKGELPEGWANYARLNNAGYETAKAVCPDAIVMVHIDNAWEDNTWWFDKLRAAGGKFDMIGLSHYPQANDKKTWKQANQLALQHIQQWAAKYNVPVMVSEVGVKPAQTDAAQCLKEFIDGAKEIEKCAGVFYWEPQVYAGWRPTVYKNMFNWGAYDMGGFTAQGRPAPLMDAFK